MIVDFETGTRPALAETDVIEDESSKPTLSKEELIAFHKSQILPVGENDRVTHDIAGHEIDGMAHWRQL